MISIHTTIDRLLGAEAKATVDAKAKRNYLRMLAEVAAGVASWTAAKVRDVRETAGKGEDELAKDLQAADQLQASRRTAATREECEAKLAETEALLPAAVEARRLANEAASALLLQRAGCKQAIEFAMQAAQATDRLEDALLFQDDRAAIEELRLKVSHARNLQAVAVKDLPDAKARLAEAAVPRRPWERSEDDAVLLSVLQGRIDDLKERIDCEGDVRRWQKEIEAIRSAYRCVPQAPVTAAT